MLMNAIEQAALFLPLVFAVFISYRILQITDLTVEGSFVFGAALFAICIHSGCSLFFSMCMSVLGGIFAGMVSTFLQRILGFSDLISGILCIFVFHSISLKSMGRPNISLYDAPSFLVDGSKLFFSIGFSFLLFLVLSFILHSRLGLFLKAFGNNRQLLEFFGKNEKMYCLFGLALSNVLAAVGGAISAQYQGFADCSMGVGVVLVALTGVILGKQIHAIFFYRFMDHAALQLVSCFLGTFLYFLGVHALIQIGVDPLNLRLCTALIVVGVLAFNRKHIVRKA